jgi:predicted secreted hydrolase
MDEVTRISRRRAIVALAATLLAPPWVAHGAQARNNRGVHAAFESVRPGYRMRFPEDEGSHPDFRVEWWYITGWLEEHSRAPLGFQITFFRVKTGVDRQNPSAFAPRQLLIAHAALSDPKTGRLVHGERTARAGFGLAAAEEGRTRVWIDDWTLTQTENVYNAHIPLDEVRFELALTPRQAPILHGEQGYSRKGADPLSASYYYSIPHLAVSGSLRPRNGATRRVAGTAWLDHEWSSHYMEEAAAGWDWLGINLDDGGALMLFRMRDSQRRTLWAGGTLRQADGALSTFSPAQIGFESRREWTSPRTGTRYPVAWTVAAGALTISIEPMMDDQENDTRLSTGTIYWEGAVLALRDGKLVGRGYLELTGYWKRLNLSAPRA